MPVTLTVTSRAEWRAWLEEHHAKEREVWLLYYKKHTGRTRIPYADAVEEALCFGWIDSNVQRVDEDRYAQKFTPRKPDSTWSELNKRRARRLAREGRMTPAGMAKIGFSLVDRKGGDIPRGRRKHPELPVPPDLRRELKKDPETWDFFTHLAPSHRRNYLRWILSARRKETRERRVGKAITMLRRRQKPGMF